MRGGGEAERLVDRGAHLVGLVLGPGALGDRAEQQRVVDLLQAARTPAVIRCPAAQHDDRRTVEGAVVIPLTPFVTPGPAVRTARPGRRVSRAVASAANTAVCSCRTLTRRIGGSALTAPSYRGNTCPPERVNIVDTPCRPRATVARRVFAAVPRGLRRARPAGILVSLGHVRDVTSAASKADGAAR